MQRRDSTNDDDVSKVDEKPSLRTHVGPRQYLIAADREDVSVLLAVGPDARLSDLCGTLEDVAKEANHRSDLRLDEEGRPL